ncbi:hypothetical protein RHMOL_Rhmol04G0340600 [Rhododendron molle]|uniref:Uncharacterized protein n=1 Tax=Rhododendron molle TaxID=49168 RepID=A0ACC0P7Q3_RHOML|nr:hypothetical protein RHMOL_Rhmol04G0340600 [Rhododendron molle]
MLELCNPMRLKKIDSAEEIEMPRFGILGSCKGLLLIKHYMDLYLWNPSIRQCTNVVSLPQPDRLQCERVLIVSGLCYDSSIDEYKAVMVYEGITVVASLKSRRWTSFCFPYELK